MIARGKNGKYMATTRRLAASPYSQHSPRYLSFSLPLTNFSRYSMPLQTSSAVGLI